MTQLGDRGVRTFADAVLDRRAALWVCLTLIPLDALVLVLNALHLRALAGAGPAWLRDDIYSLSWDLGVGEWIEYFKSAATAAAIGFCAYRLRAPMLAVLCGLNVWLVLDNSLSLHEQIGARIGHRFLGDFTLGLNRPRDLGELIGFAVVGGGFLALLALTYRKATPDVRGMAALLGATTVGAAVFGVGVDAFHSSPWARGLEDLAAAVEDGGESIMLSLGCALALGCAFARRELVGSPALATP